MERISPTRMNLLLKKKELIQVRDGRELLCNKREVLLKEFFLTIRPLFILRNQLERTTQQAIFSLILAFGFEGKEKLVAHSLSSTGELTVGLSEKNLWGVKIPQLKEEMEWNKIDAGEIGLSLHINQTKEKFVEFIKLALRVLPEEIKVKRLGKEIKSTSRKVNYLEKYILPGILNQIKYIQETLEEIEHEDIFRLKRIKKKKYEEKGDEK